MCLVLLLKLWQQQQYAPSSSLQDHSKCFGCVHFFLKPLDCIIMQIGTQTTGHNCLLVNAKARNAQASTTLNINGRNVFIFETALVVQSKHTYIDLHKTVLQWYNTTGIRMGVKCACALCTICSVSRCSFHCFSNCCSNATKKRVENEKEENLNCY